MVESLVLVHTSQFRTLCELYMVGTYGVAMAFVEDSSEAERAILGHISLVMLHK